MGDVDCYEDGCNDVKCPKNVYENWVHCSARSMVCVCADTKVWCVSSMGSNGGSWCSMTGGYGAYTTGERRVRSAAVYDTLFFTLSMPAARPSPAHGVSGRLNTVWLCS